jgi:PncC family amidohydrolase
MLECENYINLMKQAEEKAACLIKGLKDLSYKLCLAESCTAGLISGFLASVSGASSVLWGSFVCYSQEAKTRVLDLDNNELNVHGLVSAETACSMAENALRKSGTDIAASVTGLAGPLGDGSDVPIGTVYAAVAFEGGVLSREFHFTGQRNEVRLLAVISVMEMIQERLTKF